MNFAEIGVPAMVARPSPCDEIAKPRGHRGRRTKGGRRPPGVGHRARDAVAAGIRWPAGAAVGYLRADALFEDTVHFRRPILSQTTGNPDGWVGKPPPFWGPRMEGGRCGMRPLWSRGWAAWFCMQSRKLVSSRGGVPLLDGNRKQAVVAPGGKARPRGCSEQRPKIATESPRRRVPLLNV